MNQTSESTSCKKATRISCKY